MGALRCAWSKAPGASRKLTAPEPTGTQDSSQIRSEQTAKSRKKEEEEEKRGQAHEKKKKRRAHQSLRQSTNLARQPPTNHHHSMLKRVVARHCLLGMQRKSHDIACSRGPQAPDPRAAAAQARQWRQKRSVCSPWCLDVSSKRQQGAAGFFLLWLVGCSVCLCFCVL